MIHDFGVIYVFVCMPAVLQVNVCKNIALNIVAFELFKVMLGIISHREDDVVSWF